MEESHHSPPSPLFPAPLCLKTSGINANIIGKKTGPFLFQITNNKQKTMQKSGQKQIKNLFDFFQNNQKFETFKQIFMTKFSQKK